MHAHYYGEPFIEAAGGYGSSSDLSVCYYKDDLWSAWSEPKNVEFSHNHGELGKIYVNCPEQVERGKDLEIVIEPVQNATDYCVCLFDSGHAIYSESSPTAGKFVIPGYNFCLKNVGLEIYACRNGIDEIDTLYSGFIRKDVSPTGEQPLAPEVIPHQSEVHIRDRLSFDINTAGASQAVVRYQFYGNGAIDVLIDDLDEDYTNWQLYAGSSVNRNLQVCFSVKIDGVWSEWTEFNYKVQAEEVPATETDLVTPTDLE